jgi:hypothetical protein
VIVSQGRLAILALGKRHGNSGNKKISIGIEEDNHYTNIIQRENQLQLSGEKWRR